jgi:hypothetical protein
MNLKLIALVITALTVKTGVAQTLPQQVINISGGTYQQGHFSVDWSVGELAVVNTMQSGNLMVNLTNGFMQTITDIPNVAIANSELKKEDVRLLPNPTRGMLEVDFITNQTGSVTMQLFDMLGQPLAKKEFYMYGFGRLQKFDMSGYRAGTYTLKISLQAYLGSVPKSGSFKIVKI